MRRHKNRRNKKRRWNLAYRNRQNQRRKKSREQRRNGRNGKNLGAQNEHRVELALIRNKGRLPLVSGCHNAFKNGELDVRGIDIIVAMKNGFCLLLQVKSSDNGLAKHYASHPLILAFVARKKMSDTQIAAAVMKIIKRQSRLPFGIATCYYGGKSRELKRLGADMLVVLENGFGLFLKREGATGFGSNDRECYPMPAIEIPDAWDAAKLNEELKSIIEDRRKEFLKTTGFGNEIF